MKQRVIAFARIDEVPDALTALRDVESRLDPEDDFLQHEAPQAIALAYARVSEREFTRGNYSAALALLDRAHDRAPESTVYVTRREQMHEVAQLEQMLAEGRPSSAEEIERRLLDIRENEGPQYYAIRSRLAEVLARRIERLQASAPEEAGRLLELGQNVFAGASAIDALAPVDGVTEENGAGRPVGEDAQEKYEPEVVARAGCCAPRRSHIPVQQPLAERYRLAFTPCRERSSSHDLRSFRRPSDCRRRRHPVCGTSSANRRRTLRESMRHHCRYRAS